MSVHTAADSAPGTASPARVFAAALAVGSLTAVVEGRPRHHLLPLSRWSGSASPSDRFVLDQCRGATVDLGCGPGRMLVELAARGHDVLGVDLSGSAAAEARRRGVPAVRRDLFAALPREGEWETALLADGNIGIGGDPVMLLRRAGRLVGRSGRVVVDLARPGTGLRVHRLHLRAAGLASTEFSWAELGPDALAPAATSAGLSVLAVVHRRSRWVGVLGRSTGSRGVFP
jgi:SAM-dependent methyltransferase